MTVVRLPTLACAVALLSGLASCSGKSDRSAEAPPEVRIAPVVDPSDPARSPVPGADDPLGMVTKFADAMCSCETTACTSEAYALYMAYAKRAPSPKTEPEKAGIAREATRLEGCVDAMYGPLLAALAAPSSAACACKNEDCALRAQQEFGQLITREPKPPARVQSQVAALAQSMMSCSAKSSP